MNFSARVLVRLWAGLILAGSIGSTGCFEQRNKSIELMNQGVEFGRQKLYDSAVRALKAATEMDPSNHLAFYNLGAVYKDAKKWDEAGGAFAQAAKLQDGNATYHYEAGTALWEANKLDLAKAELQAALKIDPRLYKAHFRLAKVIEMQGEMSQENLKAADVEFRKAIEVNPRFVEPYVSLGYLYLDHDYDKEGVQVFQAGAANNDSDAEVHLGLGSALQKVAQYDEAIKEFKKTLERNGELILAVYDIGMSYKMMDDKKNAKEWLQRFIQGGTKAPPEVMKAATDAIYQLDAP